MTISYCLDIILYYIDVFNISTWTGIQIWNNKIYLGFISQMIESSWFFALFISLYFFFAFYFYLYLHLRYYNVA